MEDAYRLKRSDVLRSLKVDPENGLRAASIRHRRERYGANALPTGGSRNPFLLFFDRFRDVLVLILLSAALVSVVLGRWTDVIIIFIALFLDASLSFAQVWRTEQTLKKLQQYIRPHATVTRDGAQRRVPAKELVVGDVIELRAGAQAPADARILTSQGLRMQEGALTGESDDVDKSMAALPQRTPLGGRRNMIFMGTTAMKGTATAVVVATGTRTEIGKIAQVIKTEASPPSPLRRKLQQTGLLIGIGVVASVVLLLVTGLLLGQDLLTTLLTATTLIVSAIPEDLTMILTIALTVGVARILRQRGVVRRLASGETLGAATVICTDKTGTLTQGKMAVELLDFMQGTRLTRDAVLTLHRPLPVELALTAFALASDAHAIERQDGSTAYAGAATERAGLAFVEHLGFSQRALREQWRQRASITFSPEWKYRAALHDHPTQPTRYIFVIGAPDVLLHRSSTTLDVRHETVPMTSERRFELEQQIETKAAEGSRLVGVAVRRNVDVTDLGHGDIDGLLFLGVASISDPVREEASAAVADTVSAGIALKMITGDHPATAKAVAQLVNLPPGLTLTGSGVSQMTDHELQEAVERVSIFARIAPLDKQRIVRAFQARGHVVAMTGDGINDAVALKSADIGVAMGSGTDIAKQAADLILLDDSFTTIIAAIREGRVLRDNVRKVMMFLLATNSAEVAIFFVSLLAGLPLPLLPAQILWINLVTDGTSDVALSLEPKERDVMRRGPEDPKAPLLDSRLIIQILFTGLMVTAFAMGLFYYLFVIEGGSLIYSRTMIFTFVSFSSLLSVWSFRSLSESIIRRGFSQNIWIPVSLSISASLHLLALYVPAMQRIFDTVPLGSRDWLLILVTSFVAVILIDSRKFFVRYLWEVKHSTSARTEKPLPAGT